MAAMKSFRWNRWIAAALILLNAYMWVIAIQAAYRPYIVDPIRDPEVVALLEYIQSGKHSGETWQVTLTELEAEQTITWYLKKYLRFSPNVGHTTVSDPTVYFLPLTCPKYSYASL